MNERVCLRSHKQLLSYEDGATAFGLIGQTGGVGVVLGTPGYKAISLFTTPILLNNSVRETSRQGISINTKFK